MEDAVVVQRGLELLSLMTMDSAGVWAVLDDDARVKMAGMLQHFNKVAESVQHDQDMPSIIALATDVVRLVEEIPALRDLLLPAGMRVVTMSATKADLGDTENQRRAQAQKFAAQIHNSLVIIRKDGTHDEIVQQQAQRKQRETDA